MKKELQGKRLLIDGDIIVYRCGFAAEKTKYLVEKNKSDSDGEYLDWMHFDSAKEAKEYLGDASGVIWSRKELEPIENCLHILKSYVDDIVEGTEYEIYLSGDSNFRYSKAFTKPYKGNRSSKPTHYNDIRDYLVDKYGANITTGIEADDALGLRSTSLGSGFGCIVSTDKDLRQIAGWHFDPVKDELSWTSNREGDFNFYTQLLAGDAVDNVPGLDGIGKERATKILQGSASSKELYERARSTYQDRIGDGWERYMKEQADLLWIQRTGKEEWHPPTQE